MVGFLIVLLSSVFFCLQNVTVRVLFNDVNIFGIWQTGGFVPPTLENSFLLLFMRTVLVVPIMAAVSSRLYGTTWKDIASLRHAEQRPTLRYAIAGGVLMFLYLVLLYISIGLIPTGIALTLFFTYPIFTALFSWRFFGNRPSWFRWGIIAAVLIGSILTMPSPDASVGQQTWLGVVLGIGSGIAYALYTVTAQKSFESFHPVPFTWISFATTLVLSTVSLLFWRGDLAALDRTGLWIGGLISAIATLVGHLLNNYGIRLIGATSTAMIGATNPALTVVLAWFAIQETLNWVQVMGVLIVTGSVALLSQERKFLRTVRSEE